MLVLFSFIPVGFVITVILLVAVLLFTVFAVIVVVPFFFAVTFPFLSTAAIDVLLLLHVIVLF